MKTVTIAIIVLAAALWLMADVEPANACSCARSGSPKEALADADAVFAGKAIAVQLLTNTNSSADPVTVSFDVNRVWKGPRQDTIVITTERSGISCGYEFKEGRRYFVYAYVTAKPVSAPAPDRWFWRRAILPSWARAGTLQAAAPRTVRAAGPEWLALESLWPSSQP